MSYLDLNFTLSSSNVILYNDVKTQLSSKVDLSGFGTELFNCNKSNIDEKFTLSNLFQNIFCNTYLKSSIILILK